MNWFYITNGEQQGPVAEADLMKMMESVRDPESLMVWKEGLPDWTLARTLFPNLRQSVMPPPIPGGFLPTAVCCECGKTFAAADMVTLQGQALCVQCQPVAVQKIKEGAVIGSFKATGGTCRDGKFVLTADGASLPGRCVKCNVATDDRVKRKLYWHHPAYYLLLVTGVLVYVIVALCVRRKATVEVGFCERHRKRRLLDMLLGWIGFFGGIVLMIAGFGNEIPAAGMGGIVLIVGSIVYLIVRTNIVAPKRINEDGRVWLIGACREYLDSLPGSNG